MKKIIAYFLIITLVFINVEIVGISEVPDNIPNLVLSDSEIKEFNSYLNQLRYREDLSVDSIQPRSFSLTGALAGSFFIPGVGQAIITVGGAVIVAGVTVKATSVIGKMVTNWVKIYKIEKEYNNSKNRGVRTKKHSVQNKGSLPRKGEPNSSKDLRDNKGIKQRRYYDKNGNADLDIDYRHGGNGKEPFPHKHKWNNGVRGKWFK